MMICLCHPFSDKKVKEHLDRKGASCSVSEVYGACSGGEKPNCCSCLETLKDMVKAHNSTVTA
jgi:bacterioferritin-associated ferredoxin